MISHGTGALTRAASLLLAAVLATDGEGAPPKWTAIGPQGAATLVAAADPAVPDRVYAATRDRVHVSVDGGAVFSPLGSLGLPNDEYNLSFVSDLVVLHRDATSFGQSPRLVLNLNAPSGPTLFATHDNGRSWTIGVDAATGSTITDVWLDLAAAPGDADVAFAIAPYAGYRTDDGGSTWHVLSLPPLIGPAIPVPVDSRTAIIADASGVYRSADGGATWSIGSGGLPPPPHDWIAAASDPLVPRTLWLAIGGAGLFRSTDAGATWSLNAGPGPAVLDMPSQLFVAGESLWIVAGWQQTYRSLDGGRNWLIVPTPYDEATGALLARDPATGRLYLHGNRGSRTNLVYSVDGGATVAPSGRGLQGVDVDAVLADAAGRLYASTEQRLLRRDVVGDAWIDVTPASHPCNWHFGPKPFVAGWDGTLFAAAANAILRSDDGGDHWMPFAATAPRVGWRYCLFAIAPGSNDVMYSRTDDIVGHGILLATTIHRTQDGGAHWTPLTQPFAITTRLHAASGERLVAFGDRDYRSIPGTPGLWLGTLKSSPDKGGSWSVALPSVRAFGVGLTYPDVVVAAADDGIHRSDDGGATFTRVGALPDPDIQLVGLDRDRVDVAYAVTTDGRAYRSADGGTTWSFVAGPLDTQIIVSEIAAAAAPDTIVAGTSHGVHALYAGSDQREIVEFHHPPFDHYFVSSDPVEIAFLREGGRPPWRPTGRAFRGWEADTPGTDTVCRFWSGQTFAPRSSHFYTPYPDECATVLQSPDWVFEGQGFDWKLPEGPIGARACDEATQPLYRAYNAMAGGAPNHRYTTDPAVLDAMLAQRWIMEGEAGTRVFVCVPRQQ